MTVREAKISYTVLAGSMLITLSLQAYLWPHISDDAYIVFRYADRLSSGLGLTFNGGERVEGFSDPVWVLLLAGIRRVTGVGVPDIARSVGMLFSILSLIVVRRIMVKGLMRRSPIEYVSVFTLIVLCPGFHVFATAGLEGPLFGLLLLSGVALSLNGTRRLQYGAAGLFGLAGVARPEGLLYGIFWFLLSLELRPRSLSAVSREMARFTILLLPVLLWVLFRIVYFGDWLPNTAYAKLPGTHGSVWAVPSYFLPWIVALGGPLVILFWALATPVDGDASYQRLLRLAAGPVLAAMTFVGYAQGDWMPFGRFVQPVWFLVAILFGVWCAASVENWKRLFRERWQRYAPAILVTGLAACSVIAWQVQVRAYVGNKEMTMLMRGTDQIAVGEWLAENVNEGSTVATGRLGGMSYAAPGLIFLDLNGLTDREEARFIARGRPGGVEDDPILRRRPDVIAAIDAPVEWGYREDVAFQEWLASRYTLVRSFPQGNFGSIDLFIAKDRNHRILKQRIS